MDAFEDIKALELQLLDTHRRKDPAFLEDILCDDFIEIGSSGQLFDKQAVIALLLQETFSSPQAADFHGVNLGSTHVLLRYVTKRRDGSETWRMSIWSKHEGQWRLKFHQGTKKPSP